MGASISIPCKRRRQGESVTNVKQRQPSTKVKIESERTSKSTTHGQLYDQGQRDGIRQNSSQASEKAPAKKKKKRTNVKTMLCLLASRVSPRKFHTFHRLHKASTGRHVEYDVAYREEDAAVCDVWGYASA